MNFIDPSGKDASASCIIAYIAGAASTVIGIGATFANAILLNGAQASLAALIADGGSEAAIAAATTTVAGSQLAVGFAAAAAVVGLGVTIAAFIACSS